MTKTTPAIKVTSAKAPAQALGPATEIEASGAAIEPAIVSDIDMAHPAVDDNPRAASTARMNQIDFNTPSALGDVSDLVSEQITEANAVRLADEA